MKYREHYINKSASTLPKYNKHHSKDISLRNSNMSLYELPDKTIVCKIFTEDELHLLEDKIHLTQDEMPSLTEAETHYFNKLLGIEPTSRTNG